MSRLSSLHIRNYRGIEELDCDFSASNMCCLIGHCDSGKSTILQAVSILFTTNWTIPVVVRPQNLGNIILIPRDFVYDREELAGAEGISLHEDTGVRHVDYHKSNIPTFKFDPDKRPVLAVDRNESRAELENTPAIRRARDWPEEFMR